MNTRHRLVNPGFGQPRPAAARATVTLDTGESITGELDSRDEFTIAILDAGGERRSWSTSDATFTVDDPLEAHFEQLGRYTDEDMHDVYAYLETLR